MQPHQRPPPLRPPVPAISNSNYRPPLPLNFITSFPPTGITPPHPHPVAPFPPPPPHSYGTLQHGPVSPPPPPPPSVYSSPHRPQPFYSLAMTHLPPNIQPRPPLPHTRFVSPYHRPPLSQNPLSSVHRTSSTPPLPPPAALRVPITCIRCGHLMLADLSGYGFPYSPRPPPIPVVSSSGASLRPHSAQPVFFKHPQPLLRPRPSHPLQFNPLVHQPVSPVTHTRPAGVGRQRRSTSSSRDGASPGIKADHKLTKKKEILANPKEAQEEITSQSVSKIIPYRERKKQMSVEVYAQQQLEVEFATNQKPTVGQMADLSQRLGVSKEFVRHWFSSRRQKQKKKPLVRTLDSITIPSSTHDITVDVPPDPPATEMSVVIFTTQQ